MFLFHMLPSWDDIQRGIDHRLGYQQWDQSYTRTDSRQPSQALIFRRLSSVRFAFDHAEEDAARILTQRFADLDISSVITDLISAVTQMAMVVAGSALAGGLVGAGAGAFLGGVGAGPGAIVGATFGMQSSTFILGLLGLNSLAETVVDGSSRVIGYYVRGVKTAWEGPRDEGLDPFFRDDPFALAAATRDIAQGHVEMVVLLLLAIVEYLTRGRGDPRVLALEMRSSKKGERLAQWMLEHEEALKKRPDLQSAGPRKSSTELQEPAPSAPAASASASASAKAVEELKSKVIYENPRNLIPTQIKSEMSGSQIKRIAKDMEKNGFDPSKPVDGWRNPSTGRLEIQDGHHRAAAAIRAGLEKIPVEVWE